MTEIAHPHSLDAERAVLGAALIEPSSLDRLEDLHDVDFYLERHRRLFGRLVAMAEAGVALDLVTVAESFRRDGQLEEIGGLAYLSALTDACPITTNVTSYASIIKEKARLRQVLALASGLVDGVAQNGDVDELVGVAEQGLYQLAQSGTSDRARPISHLVNEALQVLEHRADQPSEVTGIPTGFLDLDRKLSGLQPSDLIIIAARPSMGKTAFALNLLAHAAVRRGIPTAFFSLEMSAAQLTLRLLAAEARVASGGIRTGQLGEREWRALFHAAERLHPAPILIDDKPALTITELRSRCRRLHAEHGLGLILVDYLQLMEGLGRGRSHSREQEVSQISRSLKALAKELGVPVVALSQLNRSLESRTDKRPIMSDLRESGAIEQDADVILFLYRAAVYARKADQAPDQEADPDRSAELIIGKQRNGPIGTVPLCFLGEYTRFENVAT